MDEDYSIPSTSTLTRPSGEDEMVELLWQNNAPVAVNLVNQRLLPKLPSSSSNSGITAPPPPPLQNPPADHEAANNQLYMAEDEMASWLHYPLEDFYSELLFPNPTSSTWTSATAVRPPDIHMPSSQFPARLAAARGFPLFSMMVGSTAPEPLPATALSMMVGSNNTPITTIGDTRLGPNVGASAVASESVVVASTSPMGIPGSRGATEEAMASTSSSSTSTPAAATATEETDVKITVSDMGDRKRKRIEMEDFFVAPTTTLDAQNEKVEVESGDEKKHLRGSSSTKRTRAAEVHNLSERRRRDRINEKMKALQDLIPRCNKSDKASMLDEAIEYLKSLQMQVQKNLAIQMMSMGCGMMPMMYQGMQQQYMPQMGMGMGMDMRMGMTPPVVPYAPAKTNVMPPMAPTLPIPPYAMPSLPTPNILVNQPSNRLADSSTSIPYAHPGPGIAQIPNLADPFQQYLAYQQMHMQLPIQIQPTQSPTLSQPGSSKPDPSKSDDENEDGLS